MNREQRRAAQRHRNSLRTTRLDLVTPLHQVARSNWPEETPPPGCERVFQSKGLIVFDCMAFGGARALSIQRADGREGIPWDVLQWVKGQLGYGAHEAVEVYPPDKLLVNVANVRWLWVLPPGHLMRNGLDAGRAFTHQDHLEAVQARTMPRGASAVTELLTQVPDDG